MRDASDKSLRNRIVDDHKNERNGLRRPLQRRNGSRADGEDDVGR
jgi:hypothetical protein